MRHRRGAGAGPEVTAADVAAWLCYFASRYGPWRPRATSSSRSYGTTPRGMEYDGATTDERAGDRARGVPQLVRPGRQARLRGRWLDRRGHGQLGDRVAPVADRSLCRARSSAWTSRLTLLCPTHPWSRHTPREAYTAGSRLLSGVAHLAGGAAQLRSALAAWYQAPCRWCRRARPRPRRAPRSAGAGRDLSPWWDRYVYGRDEAAPSEGVTTGGKPPGLHSLRELAILARPSNRGPWSPACLGSGDTVAQRETSSARANPERSVPRVRGPGCPRRPQKERLSARKSA